MYHTFTVLITAACLLAGCTSGPFSENWSPIAHHNMFPFTPGSGGGHNAVVIVVGR